MGETDMKPKISIENFVCSTKELIDEKERKYGTSNNNPLWGMSDYGQDLIDKDDSFPTIQIALKRVCDILSFDYAKKDWRFDMNDREFHAEFYVDENNNQIDEDEYAMWKRGEKRVWVCSVSVKVLLTETREITRNDLARLGY